MKKRSLAVMVSVSLLPAVFADCRKTTSNDWKEFSFPGYGFSVTLPGDPARETPSVETEHGSLHAHLLILETPSVYYFVSVNKLDSLQQKDPAKTLREAQDRAEQVYAGDLVYEKQIQQQGFPGREFKMKKTVLYKTVYISRIFVAQDRFYQVSVTAANPRRTRKDVERFFTSFRMYAVE